MTSMDHSRQNPVGPTKRNNAIFHAMSCLKSERYRTDGQLVEGLEQTLGGNCCYLPHFLCSDKDVSISNDLRNELEAYCPVDVNHHTEETMNAPNTEGATHSEMEEDIEVPNEDKLLNGMVRWSKHLKHENPVFSHTFTKVVSTLAEYFDIEVCATRLNYYPNGSSWKPFHRDSHAYAPKSGLKEDYTIGLSLGVMRQLAFLHETSGAKFTFPQKNGDVFAFSSHVNDSFLHGIPKASESVGPRVSVIIWGRRRTMNIRNSNVVPVTKSISTTQNAEMDEMCSMVAHAMRSSTVLTQKSSRIDLKSKNDKTDPLKGNQSLRSNATSTTIEGKKQRNRLQ